MNKTVIMFAGQGSQYNNMGLDFKEHSSEANELYKTAQANLDFDILSVLNSELINETKYTQPLILLTSQMIYSEVSKIIKPDALLGFSLGEYSAYYASGILSFEDTLKVINKRANFMDLAAKDNEGMMAAIIGLDEKVLNDICNSSKCYVTIANYNEPNQLVISGNKDCVLKTIEIAREKGAKRAIPLNVSGAFHSELMSEAAKMLEKYLIDENIKINKHNIPIWLNVTGSEFRDENFVEIIKKHIISPVKFYQSINDLINQGFTNFIEIGPGKVLTGLLRKINRDVKVINISNYNDLENLKELF